MANKKRFIPVRGTDKQIQALEDFHDGYFYVATDSGKLYMDTENSRIAIGGSGSGSGTPVLYANAEPVLTPDGSYTLLKSELEDQTAIVQVDDLILNADGSFYRVLSIATEQAEDGSEKVIYTCKKISTGGSGGSDSKATTTKLELVGWTTNQTFINGQDQYIKFIATSAKDAVGDEIDDLITVTWTLEYKEGTTYTTYRTASEQFKSGEVGEINFGKYARDDATSRITLVATQDNYQMDNPITRRAEFTMSALSLETASSFSNVSVFDYNAITLDLNVTGNMNKVVDAYWDDMLVTSQTYNASASTSQTILLSNFINEDTGFAEGATHGNHKVRLELFQLLDNGERGVEAPALEFEIAVTHTNDMTPIIWLGDYADSYYEYDNIQIPFRVYDPASTDSATIHLYKNNIELVSSPRTITDMSKFSTFEITDGDLNMINYYTISCGDTKREITFTVTQDPNRTDFAIQKQDSLLFSFESKGRTNAESSTQRSTWSYVDSDNITQKATFTNFNWYNNGWITDTDGNTALRISNGAKFSIPMKVMQFSGQQANSQSNSFELEFKIRNVQRYSNLITDITRYKNDTAMTVRQNDGTESSVNLYDLFENGQNALGVNYANYDAFLAWYLRTYYVVKQNSDGSTSQMSYDDLEYNYTFKKINLSNVICGFYSANSDASVTGLCLGPQDAFFSNGTDTVSVDYVEDKVINLSAVYSYTSKLMYIYINGVISGVIKNSQGEFLINSTELMFNSEYCDIDLYKIRVYNTDLNVNNIVMNYAVDHRDVDVYDQNKLAKENKAIDEYQFDYTAMLNYNNNHPDEPLMPYIIFDTTGYDVNKLPYSKKNTIQVSMEFVNTGLERAYESGELEELATKEGKITSDMTAEEKAAVVKTYYQHHCPSWKGNNIDLSVQGTSSEFYPRRNYKAKTKTKNDGDETKRVHIFLNRGPWADDYNSDSNKTNNFKNFTDDNGKEIKCASRQKYFYFDNDTVGANKFTLKVDFMESSGSYNMGFANLVGNCYSKHPLKDYNTNGAFQTGSAGKAEILTQYPDDGVVWYMNHKGNWKFCKIDGGEKDAANVAKYGDSLGDITLTSAEDFAKGVWTLAAEQGVTKVLGGAKKAAPTEDTAEANFEASKEDTRTWADVKQYMNQWAAYTPGSFKDVAIENLDDYRTSVQGFRTMAFHKRGDNDYQFIGFYNMLLDKGADEAYGFKPLTEANQKFVDNTPVEEIAECWEFENNNRTFCSFRDPLNRRQLSFDVPNSYTSASAPVVADSFEYRYNNAADDLDLLVNLQDSAANQEDVATIQKDFGVDISSTNADGLTNGRNLLLQLYGNWEKAVQWVWSTNTDAVVSQNTYVEVTNLGACIWSANTYYVYKDGVYSLDTGTEYNKDIIYYNLNNNKEYVNAYVNEIAYKADTYYTKSDDGEYVLCSDSSFDSSLTYYEGKTLTDEELSQIADPIVKLSNDAFKADITYYEYDDSVRTNEVQAYHARTDLTAETYEAGKYYVAVAKTYGNTTYKYDTKEYRAAKFRNELKKHFDIEYLATYFVMTEVFECYDSRGKNCMMASWGPLEEGGDYIWYPIFYDIDTQLGINNTGIPSFEYNVDATEDKNFSTSDSILWNNFYKYFKNSYILAKYKHLKGFTDNVSWTKLNYAPLMSVDRIEKWYLTDPDECGSIAMRGVRPLIATNLDEWYKYITITNSKSYTNGVTGFQTGDGEYNYDSNGTYFYALQGNRSLSRQQFLTNRLDYVDSWLNLGNYARGGNNNVHGRISANKGYGMGDNATTSDKWIATADDPYFQSDGTKNHEFDAEWWTTLTPIRSSYVTIQDDNEVYASKKYDGMTPVKFEATALAEGVKSSASYAEQLLYIYGIDKMAEIGDMSPLYWQEFYIVGEAKHLTKLLLGYDGVDKDGNEWFNKKLNVPSIPAGSESTGMPLLKEINLSNLTINATAPTIDLSSCEKLEICKAVGSNYTGITFAEGVALNTLYLPNSITTLDLTEANLLTTLLTSRTKPSKTTGATSEEGLFIDGLFDGESADLTNCTTSLSTIKLIGGSLGYNSYKLLKQWYSILYKDKTTLPAGSNYRVKLTDVNWTPYVQLVEGDEYNANEADKYFIDNGHYGFDSYTYDSATFATQVLNGEVYKFDDELAEQSGQIVDVKMLEDFISNEHFRTVSSSITRVCPEITGVIYIDNTEAVDEGYIYSTLQAAFPNLTFFFKNVTKGYTAKFVQMNDDGTYTLIGTQKIASNDTSSTFENPIDKYKGQYEDLVANYDFYGWSTNEAVSTPDGVEAISAKDSQWYQSSKGYLINTTTNTVAVPQADQYDNWTGAITEGTYDYIFYAVYGVHKYNMTWIDGDGETVLATTAVPYGQVITEPNAYPYKDDSELEKEMTYSFSGWSLMSGGKTIKLSSYQATRDYTFYSCFMERNVHTKATDEKYFSITNNGYLQAISGMKYKGKITIPTTVNGVAVIAIDTGAFDSQTSDDSNKYGLTGIFFMADTQIKSFGSNSFQNCYDLKYVEYPATLTSINDQAFYNCWSLESFDLSNATSLKSIGVRAFANAGVSINPTAQEDHTYTEADKIVYNIIIPASIAEISEQAFVNQNSSNARRTYYKKKYNLTNVPNQENGKWVFEQVQIGGLGQPSNLTSCTSTSFQGGTNLATAVTITVYSDNGTRATELDTLLDGCGYAHNIYSAD